MKRDFKGVWIPKEIWLSKELTLQEKLFLVEIDSLDNEEGCYASNDYFSEFFGLSKNRCSEVIKSLEKKGILKISYIYKKGTKSIEKRLIKVVGISIWGTRNVDRGIREVDRGYSEKCEENNTVFNNTFNNTKEYIVEIVAYLNSVCDTHFKHSSKTTQQHIKARLEEGYTVDDFKLVIDKKHFEWKNNTQMVGFLRPQTLFGNKFESYLNQNIQGFKKRDENYVELEF